MKSWISHTTSALLLQLCTLATVSTVISTSTHTGIPRVSRPYVSQKYVHVTNNIKIGCPINGAVFVNWYKDKESVAESADIRIKSSGEFDLTIRSVRYEDAGVYSCKAVNGNGPHPWLNFTLHVLGLDQELPAPDSLPVIQPGEVAPSFMESPPGKSVLKVQPGAGPKLRCRAEGVPRPQIEWLKNGRRIYPSENAIFEGYSLKLNNLQKTDEGSYMCRVKNKLGSITFTYTINVEDRQTAEVIPPYPLNTSVSYGAPASLQCRVKSHSKPTIRWLKEVPTKRKGSTTVQNKHYVLVKNETSVVETEPGTYLNTLYISSVHYDDAGTYVCLGINQRGGSDMREALIKVIPVKTSTTRSYDTTSSPPWEYLFGSPSATLAVLISIPVVLLLVITIGIIYGMNKKKKNTGIRRAPNPMLHDHEVSVPLNVNTNNASFNNHYSKMSLKRTDPYYKDKIYQPASYKTQVPQQYSQYSQSDGSYRSGLIYPPAVIPSHHNSYIADIPDSDSHFSSVSHTRPQYMPSVTHYERDIQSDPPLSRLSHHRCPPPPPSSYYSGQW